MASAVSELRGVGGRFVRALASRDFRPDVRFRTLVPPGVRVGDRTAGAYRVHLHDADGWQVVEQRLYCDVGDDGRISALDLLCSGFLAEERP